MEANCNKPAEVGYLDAARDCVLAVGWRRTTLSDIARRAGVSRMTIYRRWPDMRTLLADLLVREWSELLVGAGLADGGGPARERLAAGLAAMVTRLRANPLWERIVELDPELLQPYLFERVGRNQKWALGLIEEYVLDGQTDGSVRTGDPQLLARSVLLAAYGFLLSAQTLDHPLDQLDAELRELVDRYLR